MGDGILRAEEEFISREGGGQFGAGGAPTNVPRPKGGKVDEVENDDKAQRRKQPTLKFPFHDGTWKVFDPWPDQPCRGESFSDWRHTGFAGCR